MKRTMLALIALVSLFFAGGAVVTAPPAQAGIIYTNTIHNTPEDTFALDQWIEYGGGHWQTSFNNIHLHSAGGVTSCMNISPATWPTNHDNITDNSASMVVNGNDYPDVWSNYSLYVFNWINCNPDGGYDIFEGAYEASLPNLSNVHYINHLDISEYHTITSVGLIPNG